MSPDIEFIKSERSLSKEKSILFQIQSFIFYSSENDKLHEPGQGLNTTSPVNLNTRINSVEQGNSGKKIKIIIEIFKPTKFQKKNCY